MRLSWPERPTENGLSALASVHDRVSSGLSVLPLASAVGGAGTTTILAGLGRALSILGERVLLVDASAPSTLDYFYPSRGGESGLLHSTQPYSPFEGQMHVLRTDNEGPGAAQSCATRMHRAVAELRGQLDRIVVAGQDALTPVIAQQARAGGVCLMLVTPELRSLLALPAILRTFRPTNSAAGAGIKPVFILNRFQQADPTHSEIRKHMAAELGPQLLPFCIPESATVPQSLAERVNPLDLSPQSPFAEACFNLAELYRARVSAYQSISSQPEENQLVSE